MHDFQEETSILDNIMLIRGSYLPLETSELLAVDICGIQHKLGAFEYNRGYLRIFHLPGLNDIRTARVTNLTSSREN